MHHLSAETVKGSSTHMHDTASTSPGSCRALLANHITHVLVNVADVHSAAHIVLQPPLHLLAPATLQLLLLWWLLVPHAPGARWAPGPSPAILQGVSSPHVHVGVPAIHGVHAPHALLWWRELRLSQVSLRPHGHTTTTTCWWRLGAIAIAIGSRHAWGLLGSIVLARLKLHHLLLHHRLLQLLPCGWTQHQARCSQALCGLGQLVVLLLPAADPGWGSVHAAVQGPHPS